MSLAIRLRSLPHAELGQLAADALRALPLHALIGRSPRELLLALAAGEEHVLLADPRPPQCEPGSERHTEECRLAAAIERLPLGELAELVAPALAASPALRNEADRRIAEQAPTPEWALTEVLLSPDLAPVIVGQLGFDDSAAASACSVWRDAWRATVGLRPWLRQAATQPPPLVEMSSIYELTATPDGETLFVHARGFDRVHRLLVLGRDFRPRRSDEMIEPEMWIFATDHALYSWSGNLIQRRHLRADDSLGEPLSATIDRAHTIQEMAAAPDALYVCVDSEEVVVLDPNTLQERFRHGEHQFTHHLDLLYDIRGMCVVGTDLYLVDYNHPEWEDSFVSLKIFSALGEGPREVRLECLQDPRRLFHANGRLYAVDVRSQGAVAEVEGYSTWIVALTLAGVPIQQFDTRVELSMYEVCHMAGCGIVFRSSASRGAAELVVYTGL